MSRIQRLNEYMARAWALHPVVPMTWYDNGKHMGSGGATGGVGVEVRCGNAADVAEHLVKVASCCPWVRVAAHGEHSDHREVIVEVLPDAPGMEDGPTQREFAQFAVRVLRRAADACLEAGSGRKS